MFRLFAILYFLIADFFSPIIIKTMGAYFAFVSEVPRTLSSVDVFTETLCLSLKPARVLRRLSAPSVKRLFSLF